MRASRARARGHALQANSSAGDAVLAAVAAQTLPLTLNATGAMPRARAMVASLRNATAPPAIPVAPALRAAAAAVPLLLRGADDSAPSHWWAGVLLECFGQLANVGGKQLWRLQSLSENKQLWRVRLLGPLGLCGVLLYLSASVVALNFTAQSVISTCAGMAVVWNALLAPFTLGEKLTRSRLAAALLIVTGTTGAALTGSHEEEETQDAAYFEEQLSSIHALVYYGLVVTTALTLALLLRYGPKRYGGFLWGALSGVVAGNAFLTKAASEIGGCLLLGGCTENPWHNSLFWVFTLGTIAIHVAALVMIYLGLQKHEALLVVTASDGCNILVGAISGNLVLGEGLGREPILLSVYSLCVVCILLGLSCLVIECRFDLGTVPCLRKTKG